jgi:hypothetical protein
MFLLSARRLTVTRPAWPSASLQHLLRVRTHEPTMTMPSAVLIDELADRGDDLLFAVPKKGRLYDTCIKVGSGCFFFLPRRA